MAARVVLHLSALVILGFISNNISKPYTEIQLCEWVPHPNSVILRTQNCSLAKELLKQQLLLALYFFAMIHTLASLRLPALAALAFKVYNAALATWKTAVAFNRMLKLGKCFPFGWSFSPLLAVNKGCWDCVPTLFSIFCWSVNHSLGTLLFRGDYLYC